MFQLQIRTNNLLTEFSIVCTCQPQPFGNFLSFCWIVEPAAPLESTLKGGSFRLFEVCVYEKLYPIKEQLILFFG